MFQQQAVSNPEKAQRNPLEMRRDRAPLKIPKGLPTAICGDKMLLKACSIWLELKPLYYSSTITDAKRRYSELAEFLCMGTSTLRRYLKLLEGWNLVSYDQANNLTLCSWGQFRSFLGLTTRKHHTSYNDGDTTLKIRAFAIQESRDRQKKKFFERFYLFTRYNEYIESTFARPINSITVLSMDRYKEQLEYDRKHHKSERYRWKHFCTDPATLLLAGRLYEQHIEVGERMPDFNPCFTLSCTSTAKMFGCKTAGSGHYWQQKMKAAALLEIVPRSARVKLASSHRQDFEGRNGTYGRRTRWNPFVRSYFRTLPNQLLPNLPKPDWRTYV